MFFSASRLKEFEKALRKKEEDPIEKCKKQLHLLIQDKLRDLNAAGISFETIRSTRWRVNYFLEKEGPATNKQLRSIFAAALYLKQQSEQTRYGKTMGKKVGERRLKEIFNVTRKTIRKWKKILEDSSMRFRALIHTIEGSTESTIVEIPDEVESLIVIEKPRAATRTSQPTLTLRFWTSCACTRRSPEGP